MNMVGFQDAGITIDQASCMIDSRLDITVSNLRSDQKVTIAAYAEESKAVFTSFAHFTSSSDGIVQLSKNESQGGTYSGSDSMGLFWSMGPALEHIHGMRLVKKNILEPLVFHLAVFDGHVKVDSVHQFTSPAVLCRDEVQRFYYNPTEEPVDRILIKHGRLRGSMFIPRNISSGALPGVLDIFGAAGGLMEFRGALLATKGFVVLCVAYFNYDDLPQSYEVDLTYFDEAADFLYHHPAVLPGGLGVIGNSGASQIAVHLNIFNPHVRSAVAVCGGAWYGVEVNHLVEGYQTAGLHHEHQIITRDYLISVPSYPTVNTLPEAATLPVEKAPPGRKFLFVQGQDDHSWGHCNYKILTDRLDMAGKNNYKLLNYAGAGHLLEPPYTPVSRVVYMSIFGCTLHFGGNRKLHAQAQEDYWKQVQKFFKQNLPQSETMKTEFELPSKL